MGYAAGVRFTSISILANYDMTGDAWWFATQYGLEDQV
jgi:hypothetical protein